MILKHHLRSSWGPWIEDKFFALIKLLIFLMPKSIQVKKKLSFIYSWLGDENTADKKVVVTNMIKINL